MDLHEVMTSLQRASDLDLLRLRTAIDHLLQQPARILAIRQQLHVGQVVDYLNPSLNRMRQGRAIQFKPDGVLIQDDGLAKCLWLPYASIQVDPTSAPKSAPTPLQNRHAFAIGDTVSFEGRDLIQRFGTIERINQKTATLSCDGQSWRVAFALLHHVVDL